MVRNIYVNDSPLLRRLAKAIRAVDSGRYSRWNPVWEVKKIQNESSVNYDPRDETKILSTVSSYFVSKSSIGETYSVRVIWRPPQEFEWQLVARVR